MDLLIFGIGLTGAGIALAVAGGLPPQPGDPGMLRPVRPVVSLGPGSAKLSISF